MNPYENEKLILKLYYYTSDILKLGEKLFLNSSKNTAILLLIVQIT